MSLDEYLIYRFKRNNVNKYSTAKCAPIGEFKINEDEWFWEVIQ